MTSRFVQVWTSWVVGVVYLPFQLTSFAEHVAFRGSGFRVQDWFRIN